MEAGASSGTGSFPAEDGEIWVPVLSDPLDGGSNSPTQAEIEVYSAYLDYDAMDFQAVLEGPQDEHDIEKLFGGAMFTSCGARSATYIKEANLTHEIECEFYSPTSDHGMIQTLAPATALPEKEEAPVTMALGGGGEEDKNRKGGGKGHPLPCQRRSMRLALAATPLEEGACATFIVDLLDYMPKSGWRHRSRLRSARKRGIWSLNTEQTFLLPNHLGGNAKKRILPTLDKDCVEKIQKLASKMKLHL
ncbi:unnamed protein product [Triticum turgidum subsp. durum]|uniref:Uncharacterized protein n=1 Tax=Triticum turgidum subsp. durum TaxID=4567 RepID=A0A9R0Q301_TRITD|nr:unnamed protein product [Triticum turgidum subsp. durum]